MTEFRPCPSHIGFRASLSGEVRRDAFVTAKGRVMPERLLNHIGRDKLYVNLGEHWMRWDTLVMDAWGQMPKPIYPDARVITWEEFKRQHNEKALTCARA